MTVQFEDTYYGNSVHNLSKKECQKSRQYWMMLYISKYTSIILYHLIFHEKNACFNVNTNDICPLRRSVYLKQT